MPLSGPKIAVDALCYAANLHSCYFICRGNPTKQSVYSPWDSRREPWPCVTLPDATPSLSIHSNPLPIPLGRLQTMGPICPPSPRPQHRPAPAPRLTHQPPMASHPREGPLDGTSQFMCWTATWTNRARFPRAAVTKHHTLGGVTQHKFIGTQL